MRWYLYLGFAASWILGSSQTTINRPLAFLYLLVGVLGWTATEYAIHRWLLHRNGAIAEGTDGLRRWHRAHHEAPEDARDLACPLPFSLVGYAVWLGLGWLCAWDWPLAGMMATGWSGGYLAYEWLHHAYHLGAPRTRVVRALRRHHLIHHYAEPERAFGITTPLWDLFFWTWPRHRAPLTLATRRRKWLGR